MTCKYLYLTLQFLCSFSDFSSNSFCFLVYPCYSALIKKCIYIYSQANAHCLNQNFYLQFYLQLYSYLIRAPHERLRFWGVNLMSAPQWLWVFCVVFGAECIRLIKFRLRSLQFPRTDQIFTHNDQLPAHGHPQLQLSWIFSHPQHPVPNPQPQRVGWFEHFGKSFPSAISPLSCSACSVRAINQNAPCKWGKE